MTAPETFAIVPLKAMKQQLAAGVLSLSNSGVDNACDEDAEWCYTAMVSARPALDVEAVVERMARAMASEDRHILGQMPLPAIRGTKYVQHARAALNAILTYSPDGGEGKK